MRLGGIAFVMWMAAALARPVPAAHAARPAPAPVPSAARFT